MFKVKPFLDHCRNKFTQAVSPETYQAIDEMMVPFKEKHKAKVYMPKKPVKWGCKLWSRAGISGYVYDFEVCGERKAKGPPPNFPSGTDYGETEYVVMRLTNNWSLENILCFLIIYFQVQVLLLT